MKKLKIEIKEISKNEKEVKFDTYVNGKKVDYNFFVKQREK